MNIIEYLNNLGYKVQEKIGFGYFRPFNAYKTVNDIKIKLYIETNKSMINFITIDVLKECKEDFEYYKLLKAKCATLIDIEPTVNKLIELI